MRKNRILILKKVASQISIRTRKALLRDTNEVSELDDFSVEHRVMLLIFPLFQAPNAETLS